mmetsp:Transcript_23298/g.30827  ORF Transcript_23298/g.30827 Transcript_23298/m.30827 type:complete len:90 (+) Transcript_23298:215-484(+)
MKVTFCHRERHADGIGSRLDKFWIALNELFRFSLSSIKVLRKKRYVHIFDKMSGREVSAMQCLFCPKSVLLRLCRVVSIATKCHFIHHG